MELNKAIDQYRAYLEENEMIVYGGNSTLPILRSFLDSICQLLTGFKDSKIHIKTDQYKDGTNTVFKYDLFGGGEYQYNYFHLDENYKLIKINGNGERQIKRLFEFIEYWSFEKFLEWSETKHMMSRIAYYWACDERNKNSNYIRFDDKTKTKYKKLNKIHRSILMKSNAQIVEILDTILPIWEINNFKTSGSCPTRFEGKFSNDLIDKNLESIVNNNEEIIIFPDDGRGAICSEYLILDNDSMTKVLSMKVGETIVLQNTRKGSKSKCYIVVDHKQDFSVAVKNVKTGKIEFTTFQSIAESCYDALFSCNKITYKGWFNKRCNLVIESINQ